MADCTDNKCPIHGSIRTRGRIFQGKVVSDKMQKTVAIKIDRLNFVKKYQRYEKKATNIKAHNPPCIDAKMGDTVEIMETKPLSKTKAYAVIKLIERRKE